MTGADERRAVVIGAGIGGLSAAIALLRAGWDVAVYERSRELRPAGAGLSLWSNAMYALDQLGLAEAVRPLGVREAGGAFRTPNGDVLSRFDLAASERRTGQPTVVVHRADLQRVLLDALPPETVRLGVAFAGAVQDVRGVTVRLADGSTDRVAALIGADGIGSAVRAYLFGAQPPRYAGYTVYRGVARFAHASVLPGETVGRGQRFGMFPLNGGRVYWYAALNAPAGAPAMQRDALRARFAVWHNPIPALIAATPPDAIIHTDIYDRPPLSHSSRWGAGRVTLLGDAAHPMTPNLGQGGCQAIEDAVVLGRCLAEAADIPAALLRYAQMRTPRTRAVVRQARRLGAVLQWSHPLAVAARDWAFARTPPAVTQREMERFIAYRV